MASTCARSARASLVTRTCSTLLTARFWSDAFSACKPAMTRPIRSTTACTSSRPTGATPRPRAAPRPPPPAVSPVAMTNAW